MSNISKTLSDWLDHIANLHTSSIDLGLSRILPLAQELHLRQFPCPVVVVAGTNGKGSVIRSLESIYLAGNYRVAAYTSPHLIRFNERLRIDGVESSDSDWQEAFAVIERARQCTLSFFEYTTLAALWICQQKKPDVILLEVGLGGRLDAVNVVNSQVAVVTTIALDHMDWLGGTREKIGFEKAGIFPHSQLTVCGDPDPPETVKAQYLYQRDYDYQVSEAHWQWHGIKKHYHDLPLPRLKLQNVATALMVTELLDLPLSQAQLCQAMHDICLSGRYERYEGQPLIIVDVAHNPQSCAYLAQCFSQEKVVGKRHAVVGMLADKAIAESLNVLKPLIDQWWLADLTQTPRGADAVTLQDYLAQSHTQSQQFNSVELALDQALQQANVEDSILVFGSFHTVAAAKPLLEERGYATAN